MSDQPEPTTKINDTSDTGHTCDKCGCYDAVEIAGKFLCDNCITEAGCACAERDDGD